MFNYTNVMTGTATKTWKLATILDFGGHFDFSYLTAWHSDQNYFLDPTLKLVLKTKLLH